MAKTKTVPFEEALEQLEEIVDRLESGEGSLDHSLKDFEEGIKMVRVCTQTLQNAEQKVSILLKDEKFFLEPFEMDGDDV
jgi:exodeoxyribonuclease VII small subunit